MNARARWLTRLAAVTITITASAHTPDHSFCRVVVGDREMVTSFAFDFAALGWIGPIDANGDKEITAEELAAFSPVMEDFIRKSVTAHADDDVVELGDFVAPTWPAEAGAAIRDADEHRHFAVIRFRRETKTLPSHVTLSPGYAGRLGARHMVLGSFAAESREERVVFTEGKSSHRFVVRDDPSTAAPRTREAPSVAVGAALP